MARIEPLLRKAAARRPETPADKKKVKKNISTGIACIQSTFNNTVVTITDVNGNTVAWSSAGSRGFNIPIIVDGNPTIPQGIPNGTTCVASPTPVAYNPDRSVPRCWLDPATRNPRTNPAWDNIELVTASASSWYNSMQFSLQKRLTHGLQFQSSYTWAKALDEGQPVLYFLESPGRGIGVLGDCDEVVRGTGNRF